MGKKVKDTRPQMKSYFLHLFAWHIVSWQWHAYCPQSRSFRL